MLALYFSTMRLRHCGDLFSSDPYLDLLMRFYSSCILIFLEQELSSCNIFETFLELEQTMDNQSDV